MKIQCQSTTQPTLFDPETVDPMVTGRSSVFNNGVNPEFALLDQFATHGLDDLNNASLMNRVDTKFVIPRALVAELLATLKDDYSALEINGRRRFRYINTYYDGTDYRHYLNHHNGRTNRYKIRHRTYVDTQTSFLEVKYKNNKQRTLKTRIAIDPDQPVDAERIASFLREAGLKDIDALRPTQTGSYFRIALASEQRAERITLDSGLQFYDITQGLKYALGPWVVVEVKQNRHNRLSPFFQWARQRSLRKMKFSKYCMGVYFTGPEHLQRNRFHTVARQIQSRHTAH